MLSSFPRTIPITAPVIAVITTDITVSNKKSNINEVDCARQYDIYLNSLGLPIINEPLINAVFQFKYLFEEQEKLNNSIDGRVLKVSYLSQYLMIKHHWPRNYITKQKFAFKSV